MDYSENLSAMQLESGRGGWNKVLLCGHLESVSSDVGQMMLWKAHRKQVEVGGIRRWAWI